MFTAVFTIILGLLLAFAVPEWLTIRDRRTRDTVNKVLLVLGVLVAVIGVIRLLESIF